MGDSMKKIWKYRFLLIIVAAWAGMSALGYLNRNTVYERYEIDAKKTPYFAVVLEGIRDGIYPWSGERKPLWEIWEKIASRQESLLETETTENPQAGTESETETETEAFERTFTRVDQDYFDDAVFIGDSRTVGLYEYGGLDDAVFYATTGLNIYDLWTEKMCEVDGKMVTLEEAPSTQTFGKIYFQIGINEMGRGTIDGFMEAYAQTVAKFQELQPDAIIFVQGIMRVTKEKSENDEIFNNEGINARNERIAELADNRSIFYIDMNEVVCDKEGNLDDSLTFDDIHLFGSKYGIWVEFLQEHGIIVP